MANDELIQVQYKDPIAASGWTIAWHALTLDTRISDGALRLYLLLHRYAQQSGKAWPSLSTLAEDLGISVKSVKRRMRELINLGLIERKRQSFGGTTITFLLDPREKYAVAIGVKNDPSYGSNLTPMGPIGVKNDPSYGSNLTPMGPIGVKNDPSYGSNLTPKEIIIEELREEEEEEKAEKVEKERADEIQQALTERGIFETVARQIAVAMASAGMTAEDATRILAATIRSIQSGMPRGEEEVLAMAVDRLQRGIWDAGERGRQTLRRARYSGDLSPPSPPDPPPEPRGSIPSPGDDGGDGVDEIWDAVLQELRLELTRATFDTWLRPTRAVGREDGTLIVQVASEPARAWLESRLQKRVEQTLARVAGDESSKVQFVVKEER